MAEKEAGAIDEELLKGLKQAKTKRLRFVAVMRGGSDGVLILSKFKISPAEITEAKKKSGGSAVIRGACYGEDGKHVFETAKVPPASLAKTLKLIARRDTGLIINPICRMGTDPDLAEDEVPEATSPSPTATKTAPPSNDQMVQWQKRNAALAEPLKRVLQEKLGDTARIIQQFKQAQAFAAGQKYGSALNVLGEVERLVESAQAAAAAPQATDDEAAELWKDRLDGLKDALKLVPPQAPEMAEIRKQVQQAANLAAAKSYDQAHATLDEVDNLIVAVQRQARQTDTKSSVKEGTVAFRKALLCWERAIKDVTAEVSRVQTAMRSKSPADADLAEELGVILDEFEIGLDDVLIDGVNATTDAALSNSNASAQQLIRDFQTKARNNELIEIVDDCPFTKIAIQKTLTAVLAELKPHLNA